METKTNSNGRAKSKRGQTLVIIIAILFFIPMALAWLMYATGIGVGDSKVNHGQLIQPPLQIEQLPLAGGSKQLLESKPLAHRWIIAYIEPQRCGNRCTKTLYHMRQVRKALGKRQKRVARLLITTPTNANKTLTALIAKDYQGTKIATTQLKDLKTFLAPVPSRQAALQSGYLYLVDPLGNIMLSYSPDAPAKGMFKDLKRLLKVSNIG